MKRRKRYADGGAPSYDPMSGALIGADLDRTEPEAAPNRYSRGTIQAIANIPKAAIWDAPRELGEAVERMPMPGAERTPENEAAMQEAAGKSFMAAVGTAGASMPFAQRGAAGIFGGRLAKTADHEALARAEKMTAEGATPEQVWQDTGWFMGPDDKWRFEIGDKASGYVRPRTPGTIDNYKISTPHEVPAGDAYVHPDLYAAYPDLKDVPLDFRTLGDARGSYRSHGQSSPGDLIPPPDERIFLNTPPNRYGDNMRDTRSTTLHEMQHAVQQREGFVPGGNPREMEAVVQAAEDARSIKSRMAMGHSKEEAIEGFQNLNGRPPHPAAPLIAERLSGEELSRIASSPLEAYKRLYGEVEARNVQSRRDMSPEERAASFPRSTEDVPKDLQTLGRGRPGRQQVMADIDRILESERNLKGAANEPAAAAAADTLGGGPPPQAAGDVGGGLAGPTGRGAGLEEASRAAARWAGEHTPVEGLPAKPVYIEGHGYMQPGPIGAIRDVAADYMRTARPEVKYAPPSEYRTIDPEHSKAIAQAYEEMKHAPDDPATKASYDALIKETEAQYDAIRKTGLKIEPIPPGMPDPYAANPRLAAHDVAENNHLWFFPTESGFGTVNKISDNPMLRDTGKTIGDHKLLANDMFRIVHDYFGRLKEGYGFRAAGEDNAWRAHSSMYSDLARPAMTTETRGQNSWVNYGPHGEKNRTASGADTVYADQKVGLLPDWTMYDRGQEPIYAYHGTPHKFDKFDMSKVGAGEGNQAYGQGLYFAGHEPVSERYRHVLATMQDPLLKKYGLQEQGHVVGAHLSDMGGEPAALVQKYREIRDDLIKGGATDKATQNQIKDYDQRIKYLLDPKRAKGHMYKVAFEAKPEQLLDYDVPFSEQSPYVQGRVGPEMEQSAKRQMEAIEKLLEKPPEDRARIQRTRPMLAGSRTALEGRLLSLQQAGHTSFPGKEIYKRMGLPAKNEHEGALQSTERLRQMGIPGMRYLDAGSRVSVGRPSAKGTHNYVAFDDNLLRILRRYGIAGIPSLGAAGAALREGSDERADGGRVAMATARRIKKADGGSLLDWSGVGEAMPEHIGRERVVDPLASAVMHVPDVLTLPKRAMDASQRMVETGEYDAPTFMEAAMLPMGATSLSAPAGAVGAGPSLRAAIRHNDRIYRAAPGETHLEALRAVPVEGRTEANLWADRGYVNHKGHFLDREEAQNYALENGLLDHPKAPSWSKSSRELISENLADVIDRRGKGITLGAGAPDRRGAGVAMVPNRIADDGGAAMTAARRAKRYAEPEFTPGGSRIINRGVESAPDPSIQTVADPYRMMYPGIYRNPRMIAEEAASRVGPEDPAMKQLFGVTRGDLREMAKGRVGNEEPVVPMGGPRSRGSLAAQNIQTPQNTQRLIDILDEAGKHEGLRTADAWYIMDPVYKRMKELHGPEAAERYRRFNTMTGMASPGSDVATEINRGTAAHWLHNQGRFGDFQKYAGIPEAMRGRIQIPDDMRRIPGHPYHRTAQGDPMAKYLEKGYIDSDAPKVPLYVHASGVPETGFQTAGPVGDAHFSRGVGLSDTRKGPTDVQGSFSRSEYQTLQPWWQHEVAGQAGLESVPAQARLWTALGPQTGVESALGAPKLELLAQQIMEASRRLRISPEQARDLVLSGKAGAFETGGAVNAAMNVARSIKRARGGRVHVGPIMGPTGGRADKVPMEVPDGAYVIPADICSGLGQGNTEAGMVRLGSMFPKSKPSLLRQLPGKKVPIFAADGEYVISPISIMDRWGDLDFGHRALDAWVLHERKNLIKTLQELPPPAQD